MLTQEQVRDYQEQGFVLVRGLFSTAQIDRLEAALDEVIARRQENHAQLDATWGGQEWKKQLGGLKTEILHTHDPQAYHSEFGRMLYHEPLGEALGQLIGSGNVQLHHVKAFVKPPERGSAFPMHQDYPYFPHERHTMMAAIIHLSEATAQMGCVGVYPGTHKQGPLATFENNHLDPAQYSIEGATLCPAQRGDVLFFNYLTVHGSGINRSGQVRKTVLVQVRDPLDRPTADTHRSLAQGMILHGVNPLDDQKFACGSLEEENLKLAAVGK